MGDLGLVIVNLSRKGGEMEESEWMWNARGTFKTKTEDGIDINYTFSMRELYELFEAEFKKELLATLYREDKLKIKP